MKKFLAMALLAMSFVTSAAFAEAPVATAEKVNPQTEKMKTCAAEYHQKGIAKSEHRKFMSVCLKKDYVPGSYTPATATASPAATAPAAMPAKIDQKTKMKECNKEAKEKTLKGQERKDFMKSCLSAS